MSQQNAATGSSLTRGNLRARRSSARRVKNCSPVSAVDGAAREAAAADQALRTKSPGKPLPNDLSRDEEVYALGSDASGPAALVCVSLARRGLCRVRPETRFRKERKAIHTPPKVRPSAWSTAPFTEVASRRSPNPSPHRWWAPPEPDPTPLSDTGPQTTP